MNKEYWYIENDQQKGPFNLTDFLAKELNDKTIVWCEGLPDWYEFGEVKDSIIPKEISKRKKRSPLFLVSLFIALCGLIIGSFFLYEKYSFTEDDAKNAVIKFYEMIKTGHNNVDETLYPDYNKIGTVIVIQKSYRIKNILKNEFNEYEVFTEYLHYDNEPIPIYFIVHKINGEIKIKSSRGLSYTFYDDTYDYGIRKRSFKGNETDAEIGEIDRKHKISNEFKSLQDFELTRIKLGINAVVSIQSSEYGLPYGSVSVFNGSDYDLDRTDFDCKVNYYDNYDNLIDSEPVYIFSGLKSGETFSDRIFPNSFSNFSQYSIEFKLNESENIKTKIRKWLIENAFK